MFTHKFLFVSFALIVALVCTGIVATSAHTTLPTQQQNMLPYPNGIAAIPVAHGAHNRLSFLDVRRYLHTKGFVGGPTLNGRAPTLQHLQLLNIFQLNKLLHFPLSKQPGNKLVYYAHLNGPLIVVPDLPLPVLGTLVPSMGNLSALVSHLGDLSSRGQFNPSLLPLPNSMPNLSKAQSNVHLKPGKQHTILPSAYEVFDAHNGNLLAWG